MLACRGCLLACSDDDASSDAEMVDEEGIDVTAVMGNKKKRKADGDAADGDAAAAAKPPKVRQAGC